jgi:hypothetical protein
MVTVPGSSIGRSAKTITLTRLKIAVFTPMARASVIVDTTANPGLRNMVRRP